MLTVECLPCYQLEKHVAKLLCQYATNLICMLQVLQCGINVTQNAAQLYLSFNYKSFCKTNQLTCNYIYSFEDTILKIFRNFDQQKLQSYTVYIV